MDVLVTALSLAAIYGLVATGISLTWAGLGFLNMAHGATISMAGYGAWLAVTHTSGGAALVIPAGCIAGALGGCLVWLLAFRPLDGKPEGVMRTLIASLALSLIATNALLVAFGPRNKTLPSVFGEGGVELFGTNVSADTIGTILSAGAVLVLLVLLLSRTRIGLSVRALTQSTDGAALVGIDRQRTAIAILAASGALAGLASVLLAQTFFVSPQAGLVPLIKGFFVALLGGLGSLSGTLIAAILVGSVEALTATYLGGQYVIATLFSLIAIVLALRPRGIAGIMEDGRA